MKLYIHPFSSNARKARMVARHLGFAPDEIVVELEKGAQKHPEFLAKNPNGAVPVLEHEGFFLPESHAILLYLCDLAGETRASQEIYPRDRQARAEVHRWLFWMSNHWSPAIAGLNFENNLKKLFGLGEPDPAMVARHERFFHQFAAVLNGELGRHRFIAGDALTLADYAIAAPLMYVQAAQLPVAEYVNLRAWFEGIEALPAWQSTNPF